MFQRNITIVFCFCIAQNVSAQTENLVASAIDTLSLQDLMNIKISVASVKELTTRQSPGIISTISADEIRQYGARDLMDVLKNIPGFDFGVDVEGVIGIAVRGNWAHEGKVELLIDGLEMNEGLYSTLQFGNHYPIENIERIEIVRGPGSAIYGGHAAYAVINVITRKPQFTKEIKATTFYSSTAKDYGREGMNLSIGNKKDKYSYFFQTYAAKQQRSDKTYTDVYGSSYSMQNQSDLNNIYINFSATAGKLTLHAIADYYQVASREEYDHVLSKPYPFQFNSYLAELHYDLYINKIWKITPRIDFRNQMPWSIKNGNDSVDLSIANVGPYRTTSQEITTSINSSCDINENLNFSTGGAYANNFSHIPVDEGTFYTTQTNSLQYQNTSCFALALWNTGNYSVISGVRYNNNSRYGHTLVPRIGITRAINQFNLKALYSQSFRSPSTENIDLNSKIKPEKTDVAELEIGYTASKSSYLTINAYIITTHHPIIYFVDTIPPYDAYANFSSTGTRGLEFTYRLKEKWGGVNAGASYYVIHDGNDIAVYSVPQDDKQHLGLAPFKGNLCINYNLSHTVSLSANAIVLSKRYEIKSVESDGVTPVYSQFPVSTQINLQSEFKLSKIKGCSVFIGIYNLLDEKQWYIQPYNSLHAPLPGSGRELQIKIVYQNF